MGGTSVSRKPVSDNSTITYLEKDGKHFGHS